MWENTIESVKELNKPGSGCILAHCMGLGKTLQVIAFYHTLLTNPIVKRTIKRGMVVCPYNTALNWATEFDYWLDEVEGDIKVYMSSLHYFFLSISHKYYFLYFILVTFELNIGY